MTYFYIDTSSSYLYTGIIKDNLLLGEIKKEFGSQLSKYAVSEISNLFKTTKINPNEIDKIIVVSGPGSFTGIRIGMTFAKIFAWTFNIKITTITSLEAMQVSANSNKVLVPIIDARRGYVYAGVYKNNKSLLKNQYIKLEDLNEYLSNLNEEYFYITNDSKFNYINCVKYDPNILNIVLNYANKKDINPHLIEPDYLKLTEAEENLGNKNDN